GGPGLLATDQLGKVARTPTIEFDPAQGDMGMEPRVVGAIPGRRRRADDRVAERRERAEVVRGDPGPDDARTPWARERAEALGLQLEPAKRLDGRGHRHAKLVQIAVMDIAHERERDVQRLALDPAATRDLGR